MRSLMGPNMSWPMARPAMPDERPSCTMEADVPKYSAIDGRVGRYMSVTKGPKAVSIPRNMRMNILLFFSIFILSSNPDAKVPLFISREMSISV